MSGPLVRIGGVYPQPERREVPADGPMQDGFGRRVEYLRISVTDKCNLRCVYCMPEEGLPWLRREEILRYEEIAEVVRVMAGMGLRRVRLTGGEPLVRRDLPRLVRLIRAVPEIEDLALSTNAVLLEEQADELRDAGVDRVNVSLDSLRPERIDAISRRAGSAEAIFAGIEAAERAGFAPIKVNCVVMRGRNDDEVADFAAIDARAPLARPLHRGDAHRREPGRLAGRVRVLGRDAGAGGEDRRPAAGGRARRATGRRGTSRCRARRGPWA